MKEEDIKYITHYTSLSNFIRIWASKKLKFSTFGNTNDPYEYKKRKTILVGDSKISEDERNNLIKQIDSIRNDHIYVGSFVYEPYKEYDLKKFSSILNVPMWAHYGKNHKGVAIVFDKDELLKSCKNCCKEDWSVIYNTIEYRKHTLEYSLKVTDWQKLLNKGEKDIAREIMAIYQKDYFYKNPAWSYENEYRIFLYNQNESEVDLSDCVKAVIFGERNKSGRNHYYDVLDNDDIDCKILGLNYDTGGLCLSERL